MNCLCVCKGSCNDKTEVCSFFKIFVLFWSSKKHTPGWEIWGNIMGRWEEMVGDWGKMVGEYGRKMLRRWWRDGGKMVGR